MTLTPLTSEFYTFSSILIMLIMRRWQNGSLSVSYHWSQTAVSSYSFSLSSQALHSVVQFVLQCSFFFFPVGLYSRMPISCPRYLQILFSHIIPKFLWYSSFLPFWQAIFVSAFFHYSAVQYVRTIII